MVIINKNVILPKSLQFVLKVNKVIRKDQKSFGLIKNNYEDESWATEDYVDKY